MSSFISNLTYWFSSWSIMGRVPNHSNTVSSAFFFRSPSVLSGFCYFLYPFLFIFFLALQSKCFGYTVLLVFSIICVLLYLFDCYGYVQIFFCHEVVFLISRRYRMLETPIKVVGCCNPESLGLFLFPSVFCSDLLVFQCLIVLTRILFRVKYFYFFSVVKIRCRAWAIYHIRFSAVRFGVGISLFGLLFRGPMPKQSYLVLFSYFVFPSV